MSRLSLAGLVFGAVVYLAAIFAATAALCAYLYERMHR